MSRAGDFLSGMNEADFDSEDMELLRSRSQGMEKGEAQNAANLTLDLTDELSNKFSEVIDELFTGSFEQQDLHMQVPVALQALIAALEGLASPEDDPYNDILEKQINVLEAALGKFV